MGDSNVRISVVVIGYNVEKYIEKCLDSIIDQIEENDEVIFVNDGSTDNTLGVLESYKNDSLIVVDKTNGGIISARKAGLAISKGEFIIFVDGDDYVNPNMITNFIRFVNGKEKVYDIIVSDHWEERPNGKIIKRTSTHVYGEISGDNYLRSILDGSLNHFLVNKLFKRSFIINAGYLRFPDITFAEDLFANTIFGMHYPNVFYADMTNYYYQFNENSASRTDSFRIVDQHIEFIRKLTRIVRSNCDGKYDMYLLFQWYLFAYGYIQTNYSHEFKKYMMNKCGSRVKACYWSYLAKQQPRSLSKIYGRASLFVYLYLPLVSRLFNYCVRMLVMFLHRLNLLKKY